MLTNSLQSLGCVVVGRRGVRLGMVQNVLGLRMLNRWNNLPREHVIVVTRPITILLQKQRPTLRGQRFFGADLRTLPVALLLCKIVGRVGLVRVGKLLHKLVVGIIRVGLVLGCVFLKVVVGIAADGK